MYAQFASLDSVHQTHLWKGKQTAKTSVICLLVFSTVHTNQFAMLAELVCTTTTTKLSCLVLHGWGSIAISYVETDHSYKTHTEKLKLYPFTVLMLPTHFWITLNASLQHDLATKYSTPLRFWSAMLISHSASTSACAIT